jgi:hypothetical protein
MAASAWRLYLVVQQVHHAAHDHRTRSADVLRLPSEGGDACLCSQPHQVVVRVVILSDVHPVPKLVKGAQRRAELVRLSWSGDSGHCQLQQARMGHCFPASAMPGPAQYLLSPGDDLLRPNRLAIGLHQGLSPGAAVRVRGVLQRLVRFRKANRRRRMVAASTIVCDNRAPRDRQMIQRS